jgi:uncharacterized repeat protein (TIGR03803 family)
MKQLLASSALALSLGIAQDAAAATLTTLYSFNGTNGAGPGADLLMDPAGNLYGTTSGGGSSTNCTGGCGTVFHLSPPAPGTVKWTHKTLLTFNGFNGEQPTAGLIMDQVGNLYGTASEGGNFMAVGFYCCGTTFQLSPPAPGMVKWTHKTLVTFNGNNGSQPFGGLVMDQAGNLYGTTFNGPFDIGTVFQLSPPAPGTTKWLDNTLLKFNGVDGALPYAGLIMDQAGNLYGTTSQGGSLAACNRRCGTVFRLSPPAPGTTKWTQKILLNFNDTNGATPFAGLIMDQAGNLYGTTKYGGSSTACFDGCGTAFQLSPPILGSTKWTHKTLVNFGGANGAYPLAGLLMDQAGNLYGTTSLGGSSTACASGCGTVFQLSPPAPGTTKWAHKTLVNFNSANGAGPMAGLTFDQAGNLYGTTASGGSSISCTGGCGTVFRITP